MMVKDSTAVFCADIGGSFIKFGLSRQLGVVEELEKVDMSVKSWSDFVAKLQDLLTHFGADLPADTPLAVSTAGLVSPQTGEVLASNIPAFAGHDFARELSATLQRPVSVANDADCFTLAESYLGNAKGGNIVIGAILGTGVGGGLVINNRLVRGHGGVTGEWGHAAITRTELTIDKRLYKIPRLLCGCGQTGCLDTLGGARGLERLHQELHQQHRTSHQIVQDWENGSAQANITVKAWLMLVGEPLALMVNILGPDKIVVGGGLASIPGLISELDKRVRVATLHRYTSPLVVVGRFVNQGGLIGASVLGRSDE